MAQYGLPGRQSLAGPAGAPRVSPSAAAAHQLLDQPVGVLVKQFAPQYLDRVPPEKASQTFREVMKTSGFMEKAFIMSIVGQHLPKGVTAEDLTKAVNEAPPAAAAEAPAAPAAPAAAAPAAAESPAAAAIAAAPAPSAAFMAAKGPVAQGGGRAVITPELMRAIQKVESGGNPNARTGSYKGLYQLSDSEFNRLGGKGSIFDGKENERIAALKLQQEADQVAKKLGRDLTPGEIDLVHQQGVGGATAHLSNPDRPAWQSMHSTGEGRSKGEGWSRLAIWGNVPDKQKAKYGSVDNLTSGEFTKMWSDRIARGGGGAGSTSVGGSNVNPSRDGEGGEGSNTAANADLPVEARGNTPVQSPEGTGGIGSDSARAPSQYETNPSATATTLGKGFGEGIGDAFGDIAKIMSAGGARALPSTPANAAAPAMTAPAGVVPTVDPRVAEAQRQQLAMALQRLNSGKLF